MNEKLEKFLNTKTFIETKLVNMQSDKLIDSRFISIDGGLTPSDALINQIIADSDIQFQFNQDTKESVMFVVLPNKFTLNVSAKGTETINQDEFTEDNLYMYCLDRVKGSLRDYLTFMAYTAQYTLKGDN